MIKAYFKEVVEDFIAILYPQLCRGCYTSLVKGEDLICTTCLSKIPKQNSLRLENKFLGRIPFDRAIAFLPFTKKGLVQKLLHHLKYQNEPRLGEKLGALFASMWSEELSQYEGIVPVPLHPGRERQRGYNQSERIAYGMSLETGIPLLPALRRTSSTYTQTRMSKLKRWDNMNEVFALNLPVEGKRLILLDDMVTTGATLESCAQVLIDGKAKSLLLASLAMAP